MTKTTIRYGNRQGKTYAAAQHTKKSEKKKMCVGCKVEIHADITCLDCWADVPKTLRVAYIDARNHLHANKSHDPDRVSAKAQKFYNVASEIVRHLRQDVLDGEHKEEHPPAPVAAEVTP